VRERFHFSCDIGSPRSVLAAAWPSHDFDEVPENWWPPCTEPVDSVLVRAAAFRPRC